MVGIPAVLIEQNMICIFTKDCAKAKFRSLEPIMHWIMDITVFWDWDCLLAVGIPAVVLSFLLISVSKRKGISHAARNNFACQKRHRP